MLSPHLAGAWMAQTIDFVQFRHRAGVDSPASEDFAIGREQDSCADAAAEWD